MKLHNLFEGTHRSFNTMSKAQIIQWLRKNDRDEPGMSPVFGQQVKAARRALKAKGGSMRDVREGTPYRPDNDLDEGYKVLPPIDDRYQERDGLEGPFRTAGSGKVVYYDPREGKYYDPDTDMYMSDDDFYAHEQGLSETDDGLHVGDAVHLGFGARGGAGFEGTILSMDEHNVIIQHENGKQYKGPIKFVTKQGVEDVNETGRGAGGWKTLQKDCCRVGSVEIDLVVGPTDVTPGEVEVVAELWNGGTTYMTEFGVWVGQPEDIKASMPEITQIAKREATKYLKDKGYTGAGMDESQETRDAAFADDDDEDWGDDGGEGPPPPGKYPDTAQGAIAFLQDETEPGVVDLSKAKAYPDPYHKGVWKIENAIAYGQSEEAIVYLPHLTDMGGEWGDFEMSETFDESANESVEVPFAQIKRGFKFYMPNNTQLVLVKTGSNKYRKSLGKARGGAVNFQIDPDTPVIPFQAMGEGLSPEKRRKLSVQNAQLDAWYEREKGNSAAKRVRGNPSVGRMSTATPARRRGDEAMEGVVARKQPSEGGFAKAISRGHAGAVIYTPKSPNDLRMIAGSAMKRGMQAEKYDDKSLKITGNAHDSLIDSLQRLNVGGVAQYPANYDTVEGVTENATGGSVRDFAGLIRRWHMAAEREHHWHMNSRGSSRHRKAQAKLKDIERKIYDAYGHLKDNAGHTLKSQGIGSYDTESPAAMARAFMGESIADHHSIDTSPIKRMLDSLPYDPTQRDEGDVEFKPVYGDGPSIFFAPHSREYNVMMGQINKGAPWHSLSDDYEDITEVKMDPADRKLALTVKRAYDRDEPGMSPAYGMQLKAAHRKLTKKYGKGWMRTLANEARGDKALGGAWQRKHEKDDAAADRWADKAMRTNASGKMNRGKKKKTEAIVKTDPKKYPEHEYMDDETGQLYKDQADVDWWNSDHPHADGPSKTSKDGETRYKSLSYDAFTKGAKRRDMGKGDKWAIVGDFGDVAAGGGDPIDYVMQKHGVSMDQINAIARGEGYDDANDWADSYQGVEEARGIEGMARKFVPGYGKAKAKKRADDYGFSGNLDAEYADYHGDEDAARDSRIAFKAQKKYKKIAGESMNESKLNLKVLAQWIDEVAAQTSNIQEAVMKRGLARAAKKAGVDPVAAMNEACEKYLGAQTVAVLEESVAGQILNTLLEDLAPLEFGNDPDVAKWKGTAKTTGINRGGHKVSAEFGGSAMEKKIKAKWRELKAELNTGGRPNPQVAAKLRKLKAIAAQHGVDLDSMSQDDRTLGLS